MWRTQWCERFFIAGVKMHLNGVLDLKRFLLVVYVVVSKLEKLFLGFIGSSPTDWASVRKGKQCGASPLVREDFLAEFLSVFLFVMLATR